jgi:hypothetical protein
MQANAGPSWARLVYPATMQRMQMRMGRGGAWLAGSMGALLALCTAPAALHAQARESPNAAPAATPAAAAPAATPAADSSAPAAPANGVPAAEPASSEANAATAPADAAAQTNDASATEPPAEGDDQATPPPAALSATGQRQAAELKLELQRVSAQRVNNLWPWLTLGVGAGSVLVAAASGAAYTFACSAECNSPAWVSALVVVGAGVATLGTFWLLRINADNRQVESRQHQLQRELERFDYATRQRDRLQARAAPVVRLHF